MSTIVPASWTSPDYYERSWEEVIAFIGDITDTFNVNALNTLPARWFGAVSDPQLLAVPLFVLMGAILERSGLAERLLTAIAMLMGRVRGGVAATVVIVGTMLAAATGVVAATVIVMGLLSLPAMIKLGYDHKLATGAIVASGTLAQLLPPSIVLILLICKGEVFFKEFLASIVDSLGDKAGLGRSVPNIFNSRVIRDFDIDLNLLAFVFSFNSFELSFENIGLPIRFSTPIDKGRV